MGNLETFFQESTSFDLITVEEVLLFRYHNIEYILNLDLFEGIFFIKRALEEKEKNKAWQMWLMRYQWMDKDTFMPFSEFYDMVTGKNISKKSAKEILEECEEIETKAQEKRGE